MKRALARVFAIAVAAGAAAAFVGPTLIKVVNVAVRAIVTDGSTHP